MISITTPGLRLSKAQVASRVNNLVGALSTLTKEDCVGLYLDLSLDAVVLLLATIKLGLKVALCPLREPPKVIDAWLESLGVHHLFSSCDRSRTKELSCQSVIIADFVEQPHHADLVDNSLNFCTIMRTSGSTGFPKSALINFSAHRASAQAVNKIFSFNELSCWLLSLPLYHVSGFSIVMRALCSGGSISLGFDHGQMLPLLESSKISHCSLVPAQVKRLLKEHADLSRLNAVVIGGDALGARDREQALAQGWPLYETYGLTESASMVWVNNSALPHAKIRLAEDGEILVKADSLFSGYVEQGQLYCPLNQEGFFATGDIGQWNEHYQLQLIGRKSNRIISGGENIQAEEIERVFESHPLIDVCVVVGVVDERFGWRPVAFIKWLDQPKSQSDLALWLSDRLSSFKWPDKLIDWPKDVPTEGKKPRALLNRLACEMF